MLQLSVPNSIDSILVHQSATTVPRPHLTRAMESLPNGLCSLAPELKQAIFCSLPDAKSIISVIMTCSSLYHAFLDAESLVLTRVLEERIHDDTAFEACVALKSLKLDRIFNSFEIDFWSFSKVSEILALYSGHRSSSLSHQWKLNEAHLLIELHKNVEFFAKAFVSSALYINPMGMRLTGPEAQPSPAEIHRIQRIFYHFEIYCNLFRRKERYVHNKLYDTYSTEGRLPLEERQAIFFDRFPPWENEQLACIRDYIYDRICVRKYY